VPVKKKAKTTTKKAGDGALSAVKPKRSTKSAAAGKPKGGSPAAPDKARATVAAAAARTASLKAVVINALDDMKALEIKVLDVRGLTDVADTMVIASGTSVSSEVDSTRGARPRTTNPRA